MVTLDTMLVCDNSQGLVYPLRKFKFSKVLQTMCLIKLVTKMFIRVFFILFFLTFLFKVSYVHAGDTPFKKNISYEEIGMCDSVNQKPGERVLDLKLTKIV